METKEINLKNNNQKSSKRINSKAKILLKIFEIFQDDDLDDEEYDKINQDLDNYKKEQINIIKNLELELKELNEKNKSFSKIEQAINDNIFSNNDLRKLIKEDIIKEIGTKIIDEFKERESINIKMNNNLNKHYIEVKLDELKHKYIIPTMATLGKKLNKSINTKKEQNSGKVKIYPRDLFVNKKKGDAHHFNIKPSKSNNLDDGNNNSIIEYQNNKNKSYIQDEKNIKDEYDNNNIKIINQFFNNNDMNDKNEEDIGFDTKNKDKKQVKLINNNFLENQKQYQKNNLNENLFTTFNNIFFRNKQQTIIKANKIDEDRRESLRNTFFKYQKLGREKELINYFDNFIKSNILKIFSRKGESTHNKEILKRNIEAILECFYLNKYEYVEYYCSDTEIRDRKNSTEPAVRFKRFFNINKSIIKDKELFKKFDENDNDINKVFQMMYG
jgi:hypothetical protein